MSTPTGGTSPKQLSPCSAAIVLGIVVVAVDADSWLKWLTLILIGASAVWLLVRYLRWGTTNFVITSDRVIFRHGLIAKSGIEIPLERVNSVHFNQGIFERMLGAGDLLIESGAESGQQRFTDVRNPDRVQNLIHSQMELNEDRMYGRVNRDGTPAAATVPRRRHISTSRRSWRSWRRCAIAARSPRRSSRPRSAASSTVTPVCSQIGQGADLTADCQTSRR